MSKTITIRLGGLKPRNPLALAARMKPAGRHTRGEHAVRQAHKRRLSAELAESTRPPPAW
jgi:hypothetical protein